MTIKQKKYIWNKGTIILSPTQQLFSTIHIHLNNTCSFTSYFQTSKYLASMPFKTPESNTKLPPSFSKLHE